MPGDTFKHLYNKSACYISGLTQAAVIVAFRRMIMRKRWVNFGQLTQRRSAKDRTDSLRILEKQFTRGDFSKAEYEIMKSMLT